MNATNKLNSLLVEYADSHQNAVNQKIHKVCVPLIMWSLLGLLASIPGPLNWAYVMIALGSLYYLQFRSLTVFVAVYLQIVPMMIGIHFLRGVFDWRHWLGIFVIAWIGQFVGHKLEGKKPSFFKDIFFLLIGPLWVLKAVIRTKEARPR